MSVENLQRCFVTNWLDTPKNEVLFKPPEEFLKKKANLPAKLFTTLILEFLHQRIFFLGVP